MQRRVLWSQERGKSHGLFSGAEGNKQQNDYVGVMPGSVTRASSPLCEDRITTSILY